MLLEKGFLELCAVDLQEITLNGVTAATELHTINQYNGFLVHFLIFTMILKELFVNVTMQVCGLIPANCMIVYINFAEISQHIHLIQLCKMVIKTPSQPQHTTHLYLLQPLELENSRLFLWYL